MSPERRASILHLPALERKDLLDRRDISRGEMFRLKREGFLISLRTAVREAGIRCDNKHILKIYALLENLGFELKVLGIPEINQVYFLIKREDKEEIVQTLRAKAAAFDFTTPIKLIRGKVDSLPQTTEFRSGNRRWTSAFRILRELRVTVSFKNSSTIIDEVLEEDKEVVVIGYGKSRFIPPAQVDRFFERARNYLDKKGQEN